MISSNVYDYVNVLDKAADAAWMRNDLIANNIANGDTPGYKRQDVDFEDALKKAMMGAKGRSIDAKVSNLRKGSLDVKPYTDHGDFSYRMDENNVDPEVEQVQLVSNQIRYQALIDSINDEFSNLQKAMK